MIPVGSVDGEHRRGITAAVRDRERAYRYADLKSECLRLKEEG